MSLADLKSIIEKKYLHRGDFTLSSGVKSDKYFDIKSMILASENDDATKLLEAVCDELFAIEYDRKNKYKSIAGLELGGALLAAQIAYDFVGQESICVIRKQQRIHGLKKMIEGCPKSPILLVDDVISSGITIGAAIAECYGSGYDVAGILCVINRFGKDQLLEGVRDFNIYSLFKESDFDK